MAAPRNATREHMQAIPPPAAATSFPRCSGTTEQRTRIRPAPCWRPAHLRAVRCSTVLARSNGSPFLRFAMCLAAVFSSYASERRAKADAPEARVTAFLSCAPRLAVFSRWDGRLRSPSPHIPCRRRFGDRPAGRVRLCLAWKKVGPGLAPSRARGHQDSGATTSRRARVRLNGPAPGRQENTNLSR
jgi:hypothetical protein